MAWSSRARAVLCLASLLAACGNDDDAGGDGTTGSSTASTSLTSTSSPTTTSASATDGSTSDGTSGEGSSDSGSADSTGAPAVCPASHACLELPEGWTGPVVRRKAHFGAVPPACPEAYPEALALGGEGLIADPAECGCTCGDPIGASCALSTTIHFWGTDASCSEGSPQNIEVFTTICNVIPTLPANAHFTADPVAIEGGMCSPIASQQLPPASFAATGTACGGAELLDGCAEGELCAPLADAEALCVWQAGDVECPADFDALREVYYAGVDDARGCDECTCGDPVGVCDGSTLTMFSNICNPPVSASVPADGECHAGSAVNTTGSAAFLLGPPTAFCAANPVAASGEASPTTPTTMCCAG
ncbi:MAG: hypothetical protein K1X88_32570 [Nannocystaceae bacterium]|nr:hypothetical protein [Nannocystaceae bacterium]